LNTEHICFKAEPEDFTLLKQKGFPVLCEKYRQFDEFKKYSLCVFNTNSQKPIPVNLNVKLEDSNLLDTVQAKYDLLSKREAFHVICNASRETFETANIAENTQIEPSVEVIMSTPKQAKQNIARIELEKQRLELMDAFRQREFERDKERLALEDASKQKSFERRMKYVASTAKPVSNAEKIDSASVGDGNCKFQGIILPKTEICEGALKADAYGFYGNWDWTPEQIAQMEKSIPCRGVQTNEEFYDNLKLPNIVKHAENLTTESNPKDAIANDCLIQVNAK
jgi:hypothetical protein